MIGWLDPIGTRPAFRRQGLARVLLLTNLQHFQTRTLTLGETAAAGENLAMQRTVESVGFRVAAVIIAAAPEKLFTSWDTDCHDTEEL